MIDLPTDDEPVKVIQGDCLDVLRQLPDGCVDAVVTDPPYMLGHAAARKSADKPMGWSETNNAAFWYTAWMKEVWRVANDAAPVWVFCNVKSVPVLMCAASGVGGMFPISTLVWDREWVGVGSTRGLRSSYELVMLFGKPDFAIADRAVPDVWRCKWGGHKPHGHPAEKPAELVRRILDVSGMSGGKLILDPFAGSGTTGEAAVATGNQAILCEIETEHISTIRKRLSQKGTLFAEAV